MEKNLRFAMGVGLEREIFLHFGGKDGYYLVIRKLSAPLPLLNVSCELVGSYRGFPDQTRIRVRERFKISPLYTKCQSSKIEE